LRGGKKFQTEERGEKYLIARSAERFADLLKKPITSRIKKKASCRTGRVKRIEAFGGGREGKRNQHLVEEEELK